jgi:hypothetical protein
VLFFIVQKTILMIDYAKSFDYNDYCLLLIEFQITLKYLSSLFFRVPPVPYADAGTRAQSHRVRATTSIVLS